MSSSSSKEIGPNIPHVFSDNDALQNFCGLIIGCFIVVIMSFLIWKKCLFEKYGAYLPIDKSVDQ
jgi:membrane-bound acyltransferase YfiQ involved in biofilm formation